MKNIVIGILFIGLLAGVGNTGQQNPFLEKSKSILIEKASALPNVQKETSSVKGTGHVRNLKVAMVLSPDLQQLYNQIKQATTKADQMAKMEEFLKKWSTAASFIKPKYEPDFIFPSSSEYAKWDGSNSQVRDLEKFYVYDEYFVLMNPDANSVIKLKERGTQWKVQDFQIPKGMIDKIKIINAFGDLNERQFYFRDKKHLKEILAQIKETYSAIEFMAYLQIAGETRLARYTNLIAIDLTTFSLDYSKVAIAFEDYAKQDILNATIDLYELLAQGHGHRWGDGVNLLKQYLVEIEKSGAKELFYDMLGKKHLEFYNAVGFTEIKTQ